MSKTATRRKRITETTRRVYCAKHGHSRVVTSCFGYKYCARCEAQVGDSLGGVWNPTGKVPIGCKDGLSCKACRANAKALTKHDLALLPVVHARFVAKLRKDDHAR